MAQVLQFAVLKRGDPVMVAGRDGSERRVRWVHVSEIADIGALLRGGEMILTTGVALPHSPSELAAYLEDLADANVAAVVIGLGPRFQEPLPRAMLEVADRRNLPLVTLRRKTAFVDVTEEVHAALVDVQVRELQSSESIHKIFGDLAIQGGRPETVLRQAVRLSGYSIVLENLSHQILNLDVGERDSSDVLAEWAQHTRRPMGGNRTSYDPQSGWLVTPVGARGQDWGRLILMTGSAGDRTAIQGVDPMTMLPRSLIMLLERTASTLALVRLVERDREVLELHTHRSLLTALLSPDPLGRDVEVEAAALDVPLRGRDLLALGIRESSAAARDPRSRQQGLRRISTLVSDLLKAMRRPALIGSVDDNTVGVLLPLGEADGSFEFVDRIVDSLAASDVHVVVAVAGPESGVEHARIMLREAVEVANTAVAIGVASSPVRAIDLGVRGLLFSFKDNNKVQRFAESLIGDLIDYDQRNDTALLGLLESFLQSGRNKTVAAKRAFVSRPWMHEQLKRISTVLNADLEDEEVCASLQIAIMVHRLQQKPNLD